MFTRVIVDHGHRFDEIPSGYKGKIYPINPKRDEIFGHKTYKSLSDVKEPIDLAVIATPSKTGPNENGASVPGGFRRDVQ